MKNRFTYLDRNSVKTNWASIVTLGATLVLATGIDSATLTSWPSVLEAIKTTLMNPISVVVAVGALVGWYANPTTKGVGD